MAILNHAKDNRLGVWRPKQYETNGLRGRILVFRFLEPQSATPSLSRFSSATRSPPPSPLGVIFLSHIPNCAFITFKRDWRSRWCGRSPLLRPFFSTVPFFFFFVTGRRMQKREGSSRASLETGSPAAPPRAITLPHGISPFVRWWRRWSVPLCSTLRCTDTSPSSSFSSTTIGRCIYAPVCFALVIHRVFCFKSPLRSQAYESISLCDNELDNIFVHVYNFQYSDRNE